MESRRLLITGLSSFWGGKLARALEDDPAVEAIVGVDAAEPTVELRRTEFVRVSQQHALLRRIVQAAQIDTVVDARLEVDSGAGSGRAAHENNVVGTTNILAACGGADSPVRKLVFKSSAHWYGCARDDPAFFTEDMSRPHPPATRLERDVVEAERLVAEFARRNPRTLVCVLRCANALGPGLRTSHSALFCLPVFVPTILGFDPRYQFIHVDDIVAALEHAVRTDLPGVYNAAADGVLALSEIVDLLGRHALPVLPPWGTALFAGQVLRRLGIHITPEMLAQLRYGRGLDNRRLKAAGMRYRYTTREAVADFAARMRVASISGEAAAGYVYEREVEDFLRRSPSVRDHRWRPQTPWRPTRRELADLQHAITALTGNGGADPARDGEAGPGGAAGPGWRRPTAFDELSAEEVVAILPSLSPADLEELRGYERANRARETVLGAIERALSEPG